MSMKGVKGEYVTERGERKTFTEKQLAHFFSFLGVISIFSVFLNWFYYSGTPLEHSFI